MKVTLSGVSRRLLATPFYMPFKINPDNHAGAILRRLGELAISGAIMVLRRFPRRQFNIESDGHGLADDDSLIPRAFKRGNKAQPFLAADQVEKVERLFCQDSISDSSKLWSWVTITT